MIKQKQTEVISSGPPDDTTVVWIDTNEEPNLRKVFVNGQWTPLRSGGGGGVSDYSELTSKPKINNIELSGNLSASQLGLATSSLGTKADTAYLKPNTGIPKTDLASDVLASLNKADTALQSFTEQDPTVPSWAKQSTKPTYTAQEIGALPSDTSLFSGNYNDLSNKPTIPVVPTNVSSFVNDAGYLTSVPVTSVNSMTGDVNVVVPDIYVGISTNWGTSPGECYLRTSYFKNQEVPTKAGDLVFNTGNGNIHRCSTLVWDSDQNCYKTTPVFLFNVLVSHQDISGKADLVPFVDASSVTPTTLDPNKVYQFGTLSGNTSFPQFTQVTDNNANVWCWTFTTPSTAPTITWPTGVVSWQGGSAPTINASKTYEVSVMDGLALIVEY